MDVSLDPQPTAERLQECVTTPRMNHYSSVSSFLSSETIGSALVASNSVLYNQCYLKTGNK